MKKTFVWIIISSFCAIFILCLPPPVQKTTVAPLADNATAIDIAKAIFKADLGPVADLLTYDVLDIEEGSVAVWIVSGILPENKAALYPAFKSAGIEINKKTGKVIQKLYDNGEE